MTKKKETLHSPQKVATEITASGDIVAYYDWYHHPEVNLSDMLRQN